MSKILSLAFLTLSLCTTAFARVGSAPAGVGPFGPYLIPNRTAPGTTGTAYSSGVALPTGGSLNPGPNPGPVNHGQATYSDGLHCESNNKVMVQIEDFNDKVSAFCTHVDHLVLAHQSMISTEYPVHLVNQMDGGAPGTSGSVVFAFKNLGTTNSMTMTCQSCKHHLHRISKHGSKCVGSDGKGTKGGLFATGDMIISAWLKKGAMQEPLFV